MKVLMISTDNKIFDQGSAVRARMIEYGTICDELHIVIPTHNPQPTTHNRKVQISKNVFVYPAVASNKILALIKAYRIGIRVFSTTYVPTGHLPKGDNLYPHGTSHEERQPTTCLVTSQDPFENGFVAWKIAKKTGTKLELQIHTDFLSRYFWNESFVNKIRVLFAKFLLPRADGVRVVSDRVRSSLKTKNLKLKTNPAVLPIFVDIEKIRESLSKINLRKKYPQFDFVILIASRLTKEKNIGLALDAMKKVTKKHPKTGLIIVGSGPEERNLKLKTVNLKLKNSVLFESWVSDAVSYFKTADAFLLTSNYEGFGQTLVEAAASDCPIITTDVGIVGDVLRHEQDVLVCPVGDASCVADLVERIIKFSELRKQLSLNAGESINVLEKSKDSYLAQMRDAWSGTISR